MILFYISSFLFSLETCRILSVSCKILWDYALIWIYYHLHWQPLTRLFILVLGNFVESFLWLFLCLHFLSVPHFKSFFLNHKSNEQKRLIFKGSIFIFFRLLAMYLSYYLAIFIFYINYLFVSFVYCIPFLSSRTILKPKWKWGKS